MTVKELRKALEAFPEDAEVFLYDELNESDGRLDKITLDVGEPPDQEDIDYGGCFPEDIFSPHYCQGDSEAVRYWYAFGRETPIVFLHTTNWCYDYETEVKVKKGE